MKYELLLRDIYKHTERAGLEQELPSLQDAIYVMKVSLYRTTIIPSQPYMPSHSNSHSYTCTHRLFQKKQTI